ncbi:MAG TPA: helix-turn-helix domain-containing protein [Microlunatus sp.]|nr:helix-turn-helix domain-containing protein [Microlunatus sp.]
MRAAPLTLTSADRDRLTAWLREPAIPSAIRQRARIVLLAGEGRLNVEIAALLGVSITTAARWRDRYTLGGVDALVDQPRSGRPRMIDRRQIVQTTLRPPTGARRWSCSRLGEYLGVGEATVARVWREYGLAPRPGGSFAFAVQPALVARRVALVGLLLGHQVRAVALVTESDEESSEESTTVDQAVPAAGSQPPSDGWSYPSRSRTASSAGSARYGSPPRSTIAPQGSPPPPGRRPGHHGAGASLGGTHPESSGQDGLALSRFVRGLGASIGPAGRAHLVVDSAVVGRRLRALGAAPARVRVHFALDTDSWVNLVEVWSWMMAEHGLAGELAATAARVRQLCADGATLAFTTGPDRAGTGQQLDRALAV